MTDLGGIDWHKEQVYAGVKCTSIEIVAFQAFVYNNDIRGLYKSEDLHPYFVKWLLEFRRINPQFNTIDFENRTI
jgi:hypothetical protein